MASPFLADLIKRTVASDPRDWLCATLKCMMSQVSQDYWNAGWMEGTEEYVPRLARDRIQGQATPPSHWGFVEIAVDDARMMCAIADYLGAWVDSAGDPYVPQVDKKG